MSGHSRNMRVQNQVAKNKARRSIARKLFVADEADEDEEEMEIDDNQDSDEVGSEEDENDSIQDDDDEVENVEEEGGGDELMDSGDDEFTVQAPRLLGTPTPDRTRPLQFRNHHGTIIDGEQRGTAYSDMFKLIQRVATHGAKIADLLTKTGHTDQCKRLDQVMEQLAKFDQELDRDRRAVDETKTQHGQDESDQPVLQKQFKRIRNELNIPNPGRHQGDIQQVRDRLTQIQTEEQQRLQQQQQEEAEAMAQAADDSVEMEMLSAHLSDKDPYTKRPIKEPMKNSICGHIYDRESIQQYINFQRNRRQLYQCPVELCRNRKLLDMNQLIPFPEFFQMIRRRSRSRSRSRVRPAATNADPAAPTNQPSTSGSADHP